MMNHMFHYPVQEEEDVDDDDNENDDQDGLDEHSESPSPIRSHSFSLNSDASFDDIEDDMEDDDDDDMDDDDIVDRRNGARIVAQLLLRNTGGGGAVVVGGFVPRRAHEAHQVHPPNALIPARWLRRPVVEAAAAVAADVADTTTANTNTAASATAVPTISQRFLSFCSSSSSPTLIHRLLYDAVQRRVDSLRNRIGQYQRTIWLEFQPNASTTTTTGTAGMSYFSSTCITLWYTVCILSLIHALGLWFLVRYFNNDAYYRYTESHALHHSATTTGPAMNAMMVVDRWCTVCNLLAIAAVTVPTMSAPGVLIRCHASAGLIFTAAVLALVSVDHGGMPPLCFTKESSTAITTATTTADFVHSDSIWHVLDVEKLMQWILLTFLCLLPHSLGSTSSSSGRLSFFVTGWTMSATALIFGAVSNWDCAVCRGILYWIPDRTVSVVLLFWTGMFVLNATALIQFPYPPPPHNTTVVIQLWAYRRLLWVVLGSGPCLVVVCAGAMASDHHHHHQHHRGGGSSVTPLWSVLTTTTGTTHLAPVVVDWIEQQFHRSVLAMSPEVVALVASITASRLKREVTVERPDALVPFIDRDRSETARPRAVVATAAAADDDQQEDAALLFLSPRPRAAVGPTPRLVDTLTTDLPLQLPHTKHRQSPLPLRYNTGNPPPHHHQIWGTTLALPITTELLTGPWV